MKLHTRYILSNFGGKVTTRNSIEKVCEKFHADPTNTINYMISYGYLIRILRGLYYVKTLEEFTLKKSVDTYKALSLAMEELKVKWYFGLYTALRLNGVTHEFSGTVFILNNELFRPKDITVAGETVRLIKLSPNLFGFGTLEKDNIKYSDLEKTLLDLIYLSKYRSIPEEKITSMIEDYAKDAEKEKIKEYLNFYPKSVCMVVENAGLI